ncbi:hypothetical protein HNR37_000860 [Desulfurispira natronophila]|uniref:Uncharacterized protein n=1 Tax=Desulfurispira natronophila TaxID=682562 RepID=A0A7W7Y3W3_9BACT|nr:hypothetical protein [Desulfurispira natronophila]
MKWIMAKFQMGSLHASHRELSLYFVDLSVFYRSYLSCDRINLDGYAYMH